MNYTLNCIKKVKNDFTFLSYSSFQKKYVRDYI